MAVTIRKEVLDAHPDLREILKPISDLTDDIMQELNYQVDVKGKPAKMVAEEYLKEKGLI
jgi:osmoprotectant transport system substrate-binding protein